MDSTQIHNTFHNKGEEPDQYASADWAYLSDSYNGNNSNNTQFLTTPLKQQFIDYHNAYITIPMVLYSSDASALYPGSGPPNIALKQSVLDLIGNITIATDQGQTIVNEQNTNYINNLRFRLEHSADWDFSEAGEYSAACDHFPLSQTTGYGQSGLQAATGNTPLGFAPSPTSIIPVTNQMQKTTQASAEPYAVTELPTFNQGMYNRVRILRNQAAGPGSQSALIPGFKYNGSIGTFNGYQVYNGGYGLYYTAIIPLKLLHDCQRTQQRSKIMPHNKLCA